MTHKKIQTISFLVLLLLMLCLMLYMVRPFANILIMGIILAILFRPLHDRLSKRIKSQSWSALATVVIMVLFILLPFWLFGQLLFNELVDVYQRFRSGDLVLNRGELLSVLPEQARAGIESLTSDLNALATRLTANAFQTFSSLVSNIAAFVLSVVLTLFTVYYLLKDGHHIRQVLMDLSPIADQQEEALFDRIARAVNGVVKGSFLMALVQAVIATIGYAIFGLPSVMLWGLFTLFAALVPNIGTALVLVPAVLYLAVTGHVGAAVGLGIWGAIFVGLVDNFLGPKIIGSAAQIHPVLVLFSVLGGLGLFGFIGFLLGPILMATFVAMVDIYRKDFKEYIE